MGFRDVSEELKQEILRESKEGMRLDPNDEYALTNLATVLLDFVDKPKEALPLLTRALDLNPNFAWAYGLLGDVNLAMGNPDEAIRFSEISIRLNPRAPDVFFRYAILTAASFAKKDHDKTLHWANQTIALKPDYWVSYAAAAASFVENGDLDAARQSASMLLQVWPEASISRIRGFFAQSHPWWKRYTDALSVSGIPF